LAQLLKVSLEIQKTKKHPFKALHGNDTIVNMDLALNLDFEMVNNKSEWSSVDFDYTINYYSAHSKSYFQAKSSAYMYAYAKDESFFIPLFDLPYDLNDYRKISIVNYNEFFWNCNDEFKLATKKDAIEKFIFEEANLANDNLFKPNKKYGFKRGLFEHPYSNWAIHRIQVLESDSTIEQDALAPTLQADMYNLNFQLYLDYAKCGDSVSVRTMAKFDPYGSFYRLDFDTNAMAFVNMYFDLYEIERLNLEKNLKGLTDEAQIKAEFKKAKDQIMVEEQEFKRDTDRGTNERCLLYTSPSPRDRTRSRMPSSA